MRLAMIQMSNSGSVEKNMEKSLHAIAEAAEKGAELVLFPEVQLTEFFPQYLGRDVSSYSVSIEDEIVKKFCDACKKHQIMAVPNLYLREANGTYDASILIDRSGEVIGIQKMVHVAQVEQFYEQDYYTPSDDGFHVFNTEFGKIGIVVCFDRHYPESIRTESLQEADLILIPTVNTKAEPSEMFEWEVRVQAFQNSVAIAMCNRVGVEGEMDFAGSLWLSMQMERFLPGQMTQSRLCMWILTWRNPGKCGRKDLILGLGEKSFMYNVAEIVSKYDCLH